MTGDRTIRLGTSETDGTFWSLGTTIATLFDCDHGIAVDVFDAGRPVSRTPGALMRG